MKKKLVSLITAVALLLAMIIPANTVCAASNPYPYQHNITGRWIINCTWYAWQLAYERTGVALPAFGNAGQWYDQAAAYGYAVGSTPAPNSIAVWVDSSYGHVGYVSQVNGTQIFVEEGGYNSASTPDGIHTGWLSGVIGSTRSYGTQSLKGYIYLGQAPEQVPIQNPWVEVLETTEITATNARLNAIIHNPSGKYITTVGVYVSDPDGNLISEHYEPIAAGYNTYDGVKMWYNITQELGLTLEPATTYSFQMLCIASGDYFTGLHTFSTAGNYTLSFDANGGTCDTSSIAIHRGDVYSMPIPTRAGYAFGGWSTAPNSWDVIESGEKYMLRGDQTLYAQWSKLRIPGDVDLSGVVDVADIVKAKTLIMTEQWDYQQIDTGDLNGSGTIDVGDIMAIKNIIMGA